MALARRFEDLRAWQAARDLTSDIYDLARRTDFARDFALSDQIRRAAISTMNSIEEGFDSASRAEFARFLRYAARSASEVQSCLHVAVRQAYVSSAEFNRSYRQAASVRRLCVALIGSLTQRRAEGNAPQVREPDAPACGAGLLSPVTGHRSPVTQLF